MTDDRLLREGSPPSGQLASPVPQYWDPDANGGKGDWRKVEGAHGAPRAILYGPNGQPISASNRLPVDVGEQVATEDTLSQAVSKLNDLLTRLDQKLTVEGEIQLKGRFVERVVLDVTDNGAGFASGSSARYIVGRNVRTRTTASTGNGFLPIDCRGLVSLSMSLVNPSSGDRQFFDHWGVAYYDSLGPFNARSNLVFEESVDFGEVPPGSQLVVDLMPYVRRGYMGIGIWFHTYDPSDTPGEYTFHFRGVRSLLGVPDGDS